MRNKKVFATIVSLLTAVIMMLSVSAAVYAADEPQAYETQSETLEPTQAQVEDITEPEQPQETYEPETEPPTQPTESVEQTQPPQTTEDTSKKENSLPDIGDMVVPTSIPIPKAEVSDVSLVGGVISWLCVAVGIAVLAGVLVSQRAKQVSKPRDNRRR